MYRRLLAVLTGAALALSACAQPSKQYVNADAYGMFFALPRTWEVVPVAQLEKAQAGWDDDAGQVFVDTLLWQRAWGGQSVAPKDVFGGTPPEQPTAYAFVRELLDVERQQIGNDIAGSLREIVLPATTLAMTGIDIESREWRKNGFVGIRQTATYPMGGERATVDIVSMLSPERNRLYNLTLRCTADCYAANKQDFELVMDSLTFEETRG